MATSSPVDSGTPAASGTPADSGTPAAYGSPVSSGSAEPGVDKDLHDVSHLVHEEFDDHLDPHAVDECLSKVSARFDGATVRAFVPLLVRRYAREELLGRLRHTSADRAPGQAERQLSQ